MDRIVDSGGGDGGPSSSKTVVLNNGEMIEEVDVVIMAILEFGGGWRGAEGGRGVRCHERIL